MSEEKKVEVSKEADHEEGEAKPKKKGLPLLWIIVGFLVVVLGAVGGFFFMKGDAKDTGKKHAKAEHGAEEGGGEEHAVEEEGGGGEPAAEEGGGEEHAAAEGGDGGGHGASSGGDEAKANCPKHEEGGGHGAKAPTYTDTYSLEPFIVNLSGDADVKFLKVTLKLKLALAECTPLVDPHVAEMRDSILLLLSSKEYTMVNTVQGKMELRDEILERVQHIVKGNKVKAAFFTDFVAQ